MMDIDQIFKALGDPTRLQIVRMLAESGEVCVCKIVDSLGLNQSAVSHHMGKLKQAGLLYSRREGQWIHYSLNIEVLKSSPLAFLEEIISIEQKPSNISLLQIGDCVMAVTQQKLETSNSVEATRTKLLAGIAKFTALGAVWYAVYRSLQPLADWLTYSVLGFSAGSHIGSAVSFFIFEVPKVLMLLALVVFGVGIIRSYFTPERTRQILAGKRESVGNVLAAMLGIVTPFCSCSAVPLFMGFVQAGVPLGVTLSFLIAAPMINEVAVVLLFGLFGWKVAAIYISTGLFLAITAGWVIGRLKLERFVEDWVYQMQMSKNTLEMHSITWTERVDAGKTAMREIVGRVWPYVVVGIAVGAGIHGYVPEGLMASFMGEGAWWSVPLAVILGIPMYSNAAGIVPVVSALISKGAALGTVLAFMMSVIALSLPEMIILRKVLKLQLIAVFVGVVAAGILAVGYLFNFIF